ncbi:N-acetylglucosaminyl-phosphatidylinositol de-N-acetylase [Nakaseomyces glabratus]|nr:N-acetylglucosaminyl-phosphatidylinositol de-N-acetylase [Nakaseomyces glabratus]KTB16533.1 N-acetylglucosaminyl-phosphatidylinositol de-N-acetylase [Nakaseomyces glabratus]
MLKRPNTPTMKSIRNFPFSKLLFKLTKLTIIFQVLYIYFTPKVEDLNKENLTKLLPTHDNFGVLNLVIAHPDDEIMFFSPTILQLIDHVQELNVVCLSNGDADGLGELRAKELKDAIGYLTVNRNLRNVSLNILDYTDGQNEVWSGVATDLKKYILTSEPGVKQKDIILTFDREGISGHRNHIACNEGVISYLKTIKSNSFVFLELKSLSTWQIISKYSGVVPKLLEIIYNKIRASNKTFMSYLPNRDSIATDSNVCFISTFDQYALSFAAMCYAHKSQMVWFRYLWWSFSRYVFVNDLSRITV